MTTQSRLLEILDIVSRATSNYQDPAKPRPDAWSAMVELAACAREMMAEIERLRNPPAFQPTACDGIPDSGCNYLMTTGWPCNKCGRVHDGLTPAEFAKYCQQRQDYETARTTNAFQGRQTGRNRPDIPSDAGVPVRHPPDTTPNCSTHPDAPHGFNRNASHSEGRYVCDCEGWEPEQVREAYPKVLHIGIGENTSAPVDPSTVFRDPEVMSLGGVFTRADMAQEVSNACEVIEAELAWPDEQRIDVIGSNGGDHAHSLKFPDAMKNDPEGDDQ